jgi:hypothetical protein
VRLEATEQRTLQYASSLIEEGTVAESMTQLHTGAVQPRSKDDAMRHGARSRESSVATSVQDTRTEPTKERVPPISGKVSSLSNSRQGQNPLVLPWRFNKLPHPVDRMLKQLPSVDGSEANALLQFLQRVIEIRAVCNITNQVLLQVICPYYKKLLSSRIKHALSHDWSFDQFHGDVICSFVPRRRFNRLKQEICGRLQREQESLATYFEDFKQAALVLRFSLSETEIVANIVRGLSKTQQRSCLIFKNPRATFQELDQLCVLDQNVSFNDHVRAQDVSARSPSKSTSSSKVSGGANVISSTGDRWHNVSRVKRCFYCHREGHVANDCQKRLAESSRQDGVHQSCRSHKPKA